MNGRDDEALLRDYAENRSEDAFRELALRHGQLVYGACLRALGRPDLAEDAAQAVFLILARKADRIRVRTTLVPWCLGTARLVCRAAARAERKRLHHESPLYHDLAGRDVAPDAVLFDALDLLRGPEREAIVLRFVQGLSLAEVGTAQGVSEDAARMRIQRALSRLRTELSPATVGPTFLLVRLSKPTVTSAHVQALAAGAAPLMSIPLTLSVGAVATIAIAGTFVSHTNHQVENRPSVAAPQIGQVAPAPIASKQAANSEGLVIPSLDQSFTLAYHITYYDLRTKPVKDAEIEQLKKQMAADIDADRISQARVDEMVEAVRKQDAGPPTQEDLTISFDGKTLLFETRPGDGNKPPFLELVANNRTVSLYANPDMYMSAGVMDGIAPYPSGPIPFVGPSLPHMPVTRGGKVLFTAGQPFAGSTGDRLVYVDGNAEGSKEHPVTRVVYYLPGTKKINAVCLLSHFQTLGRVSVASQIVNTSFVPGRDVVMSRREFRLESARAGALADELFRPEHYLLDGTHVDVDVSNGRRRNFQYLSSKGSFAKQSDSSLMSSQ